MIQNLGKDIGLVSRVNIFSHYRMSLVHEVNELNLNRKMGHMKYHLQLIFGIIKFLRVSR